MSCHDDPVNHDYQMDAEAGCSSRPPQLKESNCRYRCGWGCCEPAGGDDEDGGGGGGRVETPTLVDSDNDIGIMDEPLRVGHHGFPPSSRRNLRNEEEPMLLGHGSEESPLHRYLHDRVTFAYSSTIPSSYGGLDSIQNEATTRSHSSAASEAGSVGNVPLDRLVAEVGSWDENHEANQFPGFFRKMPLRLSPQYEHCRGPSLSHLVTQDVSTLLHLIERGWRVRTPIIDYMLHRDADFLAH